MKKIGLILITLFLLGSCGSISTEEINRNQPLEKKTVDFRVTDKIVKNNTDSSRYLIFTNKGTYEITDSVLSWNFNSSDIYGYIEKDKCYNVGIQALSFRLGFTSSYENITSAREIDCEMVDFNEIEKM